MNELDTLKRAKMYIDSLANGIDPISGNIVSDDTVLNNIRLEKCFMYVSGILDRVINNNGEIGKREKRKNFTITEDELSNVELSDTPIVISKLCQRIDDVATTPNMKKLPTKKITEWLVAKGFLNIIEKNGKNQKVPSEVGFEIGITIGYWNTQRGQVQVNLYSIQAQQFIVDSLLQILSEQNSEV